MKKIAANRGMIGIQRLNMDNSLFLEIGNWKLVIDPWLEGTEVDYFSWFNTQWHRTKPVDYELVPAFDTVMITQKYPDHFHAETLKKLNPSHIIAPKSLAKKLKKLLPKAKFDFLDASENELMVKDVKVTFLPTQRKIDPIYDAFILDDGTESVFLATHGFAINEKTRELVKKASPCQLLICPFNYYKLPFFLGGVVSPGLDGVKHLSDAVQPTKIIAVHDEDKHAKGLVTKFAKIIRPETSDSLKELPWLANRYEELNHYQRIELT